MVLPTDRFDEMLETHNNNSAEATQAPREASFSPYVDNGGTVITIAGDDFAICVSDTRLSTGFRIYSRDTSKHTKLTDKCIIASAGMQADINTLHKLLLHEVGQYEFQHRKPPSIEALSQLLSTILYKRRFFPYYTFNALIGLDTQGKGAVYDFDAIGSFQRNAYSAQGTGSTMAISLLDNQIARHNQQQPPPSRNKVDTINLAKDVITTVAERNIYTGDAANVIIIDAGGISMDRLELKKD